MIHMRFTSPDDHFRALGWLAGRFSFKSWADGGMIVSEQALPMLALEGVSFVVDGPAKYAQIVPSIRNTAAASVQ